MSSKTERKSILMNETAQTLYFVEKRYTVGVTPHWTEQGEGFLSRAAAERELLKLRKEYPGVYRVALKERRIVTEWRTTNTYDVPEPLTDAEKLEKIRAYLLADESETCHRARDHADEQQSTAWQCGTTELRQGAAMGASYVMQALKDILK